MGKFKWDKDVSIEELVKLISFFYNCQIAAPVVATKNAILNNAEAYLQKGERLVSLAKEHFAKTLNELSISSFEEDLFEIELSDKDTLISNIAKKVVRPILKNTPVKENEAGEKYLDKTFESFKQLSEYLSCFSVEIEVASYCRYNHRFRRVLDAGDTMLLVDFNEKDLSLNIYGTKCHTHSEGNKNILFRNGDCVADIANFLSWLICCSVFQKVVQSEEYLSLYKLTAEKDILWERRSAIGNMIPFRNDRKLNMNNHFVMKYSLTRDEKYRKLCAILSENTRNCESIWYTKDNFFLCIAQIIEGGNRNGIK